MKIGEMARLLGVSTDTLRYYEQHGLLSPSERSDSGYRLYNEAQLKQMQFILRAKEVGFSLKETFELLQIKVDKNQHSCEEVKAITLQKLELVRTRIAELQRFEQSLSKLAKRCCGGQESADFCSILTALEDVDGTCN
ncbi:MULTISPECIES: Zn(2+)-responsive transcriptional regulator [Pseudoalteromonas]|uniref:Zinc-responsive transcriptional regulator n=1 Tax=Pseudoalteromonas amylolytica TaxID=1859457 RepID=A0A1S1MPX5_9GAMM|nr:MULTISPECIES: Zn(2+)-responsive transcriptional regulator [Pseudoalteromonas]MCF6436831.1 Zn(2+)-responsive transcriptional regulator [Pseudoalteromonas sp. MMG022]OHU88423.1 zinc-responsive transcriptional regulator [Pseudoalteromonas sp. JW3]OHU90266.1 zinc-responsive transcriptional regulator [Pseudoalteromonas amylolytica]